MRNGFRIRCLGETDMPAAAIVHRTSFDARLPWLAGLHTAEEDRDYWSGPLFGACEIWGAERADMLLGVIAFRHGWIEQFYVLPEAQAQGIGAQFVDIAKATYAELRLWTFQRNGAARNFYERHGFVAIRETDGADNEEREPDVLYGWQRALV